MSKEKIEELEEEIEKLKEEYKSFDWLFKDIENYKKGRIKMSKEKIEELEKLEKGLSRFRSEYIGNVRETIEHFNFCKMAKRVFFTTVEREEEILDELRERDYVLELLKSKLLNQRCSIDHLVVSDELEIYISISLKDGTKLRYRDNMYKSFDWWFKYIENYKKGNIKNVKREN